MLRVWCGASSISPSGALPETIRDVGEKALRGEIVAAARMVDEGQRDRAARGEMNRLGREIEAGDVDDLGRALGLGRSQRSQRECGRRGDT